MSIGNILIRPQLLERRPSDEGAQALDLLTGLGSRLLEDFLHGGPASQKITAALEANATDFFSQFNARLQVTREKLLEWIDPYLSVVRELSDLGSGSTDNVMSTLNALINLTAKLIDDLHSARIADRLNALADILEHDLGLSTDTFNDFYHGCFDRVTQDLSQEFLQGTQTEGAINNYLVSRQLLTIRRILLEQIAKVPLPNFDRRVLIRDLQLQLEASDWDERLDAIQDKLASVPDQLGKILPLLSQGFSTNSGISASVLRDGGDEGGQFSWYASWFRGEGTGTADRFSLSGEPFAEQMNFDPIPLGFLEHWAHITFAIDEAARALRQGIQYNEVGNRFSPILNLIWESGMSITTLLAFKVEGKTWVDFYKVKTHSAFQFFVPKILTFGASFEQYPGFRGWLWNNLLNDLGNTGESIKWPDLFREFFLSLFTAINSNDSQLTKNHQKITGITGGSRTAVGAHLAALAFGRKNLYYMPLSGPGGITALTILGGGAMTWSFDIIGWLVSGALSGRLSDSYWSFGDDGFVNGAGDFLGGKNAFGSLFVSFIEFFFTWKGFWDGRTDGGKFGVKVISRADGSSDHVDANFAGYPPKNTSPYRLPFEPGSLALCSQGHLALSSHNYFKGTIYAVDFLLNEGELVLAMRDGTIVEYRDSLENGSDYGKNYVLVRHDTPNPEHDRGENGQVTSTYARYEHASPFGVRQAFALMGIPERQILGTKVQQGFPLMRVGKRPGFFFKYDYLQVQVSGSASDGLLPTIPFVFSDLPGDGVPRNGKYYGSGNTSKAPVNLSQYHPGQSTGWVLESGVDFIKLQSTAIDSDEAYAGAHFIVWYNLNGIYPWYEYQKVKTYDSGERKITIDGNWLAGHPPPPNLAQYRIGARPFANAGTFDKRFAYLANRDGSGQAQPFGDGHAVYTLAKMGYYQAPSVSGSIVGGGSAGSSEVHLDTQATGADHEYNFRHIIIRRAGTILQYRLIQDFRIEAGVRKIFINGVWDVELQTAPTADTYEIGVPAYWQASAVKVPAFLAPDLHTEQYAPDKFRDGENSYRYYTAPLAESTG